MKRHIQLGLRWLGAFLWWNVVAPAAVLLLWILFLRWLFVGKD